MAKEDKKSGRRAVVSFIVDVECLSGSGRIKAKVDLSVSWM